MIEHSTLAETSALVDQARAARSRVAIFEGVLADEIGQLFLRLLDNLAPSEDNGRFNAEEITGLYCRLFALLAEEAELSPGPVVGDAWQNHLLSRLLLDENTLSKKAQLAGASSIGPALAKMAAGELRALQSLYRLHAAQLTSLIDHRLRLANGMHGLDWLVPWDGLRALEADGDATATGNAWSLKRRFAAADDWGALAPDLISHYETYGTGIFARYRAFRWTRDGNGGRLVGTPHPDPVRLSDLVAYEPERALVIRNTEQFLAGFPANNVLLYGDRGTGKSSTIKALLNEYWDRGLRLIEVPRHLLADYPEICLSVRGRRERFILFIDDLSFDENETSYKDLKAILEGGVEARPDNLLLYATSNRRHLVQERFSDRYTAANDDEIHSADTAQEKLSLSDRFGITVTFLAPDQQRYLRIVSELAAQRDLTLPDEELKARALAWAARHNGRSGRTARQFIDFLTGEAAVTADEAGK